MKYYFAHPMSIYNTRKEALLIDMINKTTFLSNPWVLNPSDQNYQNNYIQGSGMGYFLKLVDECDSVIIYPFEDGFIGAGVAAEAQRAFDTNKRVYYIHPDTFRMEEIFELKDVLNVEETRERLKILKK